MAVLIMSLLLPVSLVLVLLLLVWWGGPGGVIRRHTAATHESFAPYRYMANNNGYNGYGYGYGLIPPPYYYYYYGYPPHYGEEDDEDDEEDEDMVERPDEAAISLGGNVYAILPAKYAMKQRASLA